MFVILFAKIKLPEAELEIMASPEVWTENSKPIEFMGPTMIDLFNTEGYFMPGTPLRIKYRKNRDAFYVTTPPGENAQMEYNFCIEKISLQLLCINIDPRMSPLLEMQTDEVPARYEYDALDMKQFSVPKGTIVQRYNRVYEGKVPKRLAIGFFKQSAFSGRRDENPFLTWPMDLRQITLYLNGVAVREMRVDFNSDNCMEAYNKFLCWMGGCTRDNFVITYGSLKSGYRYFCMDLLENCSPGKLCGDEMITQGFIDIGIHLGGEAKEHSVMAVFAEVPECLEINRERAARHVKSIN